MSQRAQPINRVKWDDAYFVAEAAREPFQDVNLVTARSEFVKLIYNVAADSLYKNGFTLTRRAVDIVVNQLLEINNIYVYETVTIDDKGITICIDAPNVENVDITFTALDMLADALDQLDGGHGVVKFGSPLRFSLQEMKTIFAH